MANINLTVVSGGGAIRVPSYCRQPAPWNTRRDAILGSLVRANRAGGGTIADAGRAADGKSRDYTVTLTARGGNVLGSVTVRVACDA